MKKLLDNIYINLFATSLFISLIMIGAGYIAVPLLTKRYVDDLKLIDKDEMSDLVSIAQSGPGAIAVNSSLAVGYKLAGIPGAFCALFGAILPPLILVTIFEAFYSIFANDPDGNVVTAVFRGMSAAIAAIMIDLVLQYTIDSYKKLKWIAPVLIALSFSLSYFLNVNPALMVFSSVIIFGGISVFRHIRNAKKDVKKEAKK